VAEIIARLKQDFLPNLSDGDLDRVVRVDFLAESSGGGTRLAFQSRGALEQVLWEFKRDFLDRLATGDFRKAGVLKIMEDQKVIQPGRGLWTAAKEEDHLSFFGFSEPPFSQTPNPRYFYGSPSHAEAVSRLTYAVERKLGFALLTGEIGCGKTTVCRTALRSFDRRARVALITSTFLSRNDLLVALCEEFEAEPERRRKVNFLRAIQHFLIEQYERDRPVVLVLDEAQNLDPSVLEEVRMLSNLETDDEKLIQIVLMGQPELATRIEKPELEQLRQRIAVRYHLYPLDLPETRRYIEHRLSVAGGGRAGFSPDSFAKIYEISNGIPRLINGIAESSLMVACSRGRTDVTAEIVEAAAMEREGKSRRDSGRRASGKALSPGVS
jgi:general secretion pathway protein A